jgi:hypothetical protein
LTHLTGYFALKCGGNTACVVGTDAFVLIPAVWQRLVYPTFFLAMTGFLKRRLLENLRNFLKTEKTQTFKVV